MSEAVQRVQNYNAIEDLMLVHTSQKNKGEVFEKHRKEFQEIFGPLETLEKQRVEVNATITTNIGPFA